MSEGLSSKQAAILIESGLRSDCLIRCIAAPRRQRRRRRRRVTLTDCHRRPETSRYLRLDPSSRLICDAIVLRRMHHVYVSHRCRTCTRHQTLLILVRQLSSFPPLFFLLLDSKPLAILCHPLPASNAATRPFIYLFSIF